MEMGSPSRGIKHLGYLTYVSAFLESCIYPKITLPFIYDLTFKPSYIIKAFRSWLKFVGFANHGFPKPCLQKKAEIFTECEGQFKNSANAFHDRDGNFVV